MATQIVRPCPHCGNPIDIGPKTKHCCAACAAWARVDRSAGPDGCWPWLAGTSKGYGSFRYRGRLHLAHRVALETRVGPLGDLQACHRCDNPLCCNPTHLFAGTQADNMHDMAAKGRSAKTPEWRKKASDRLMGHPVSGETRELIRMKARGRQKSPETIAKFRATVTGMKRTEESKERMRASRRAYFERVRLAQRASE